MRSCITRNDCTTYQPYLEQGRGSPHSNLSDQRYKKFYWIPRLPSQQADPIRKRVFEVSQSGYYGEVLK